MDRSTVGAVAVGVVAGAIAGTVGLVLSGDPSLAVAGAVVYGPFGWLAVRHHREGGDELVVADAPYAYGAGLVAMLGGAVMITTRFGSPMGEAVVIFLVFAGVFGAGGFATAVLVRAQDSR